MNAPLLPVLRDPIQRLTLDPAVPEEPVLRLTVEAYHALLASGILHSGDPVELLEGFLVPKMTKGPRHAAVKRRFLRLINPFIPSSYFVDAQEAMTVADSEPEPDVYVVRGADADFSERHPGPGEVGMVVEIADSSVHRDRTWKKRIYARAGLSSYWVINLVNDTVEVFREPTGDVQQPTYASATVYRRGDEIPLVLAGSEIGRLAVLEIMGEPK